MEKFIYAVRDTKTNTDVSLSNSNRAYYNYKGHVERIIKENSPRYELEPRYKVVTYKLIEVEN